MPRNMSFALTTHQILRRTKTVTRRLGWKALKPGALFWACEKCQGLKKGERIKRLALLRCVSNREEGLNEITGLDLNREGFPTLTRGEFIKMFCREMGGGPTQRVQRIKFEYAEQKGGTTDES